MRRVINEPIPRRKPENDDFAFSVFTILLCLFLSWVVVQFADFIDKF